MAKITALKYCRKIDLQKLADELGVKIEEGDTMAIIIQKIEEANDYDEEMAVTQAGYIVQDRGETAAREKENERLNREEREREKEREYEKAKLD